MTQSSPLFDVIVASADACARDEALVFDTSRDLGHALVLRDMAHDFVKHLFQTHNTAIRRSVLEYIRRLLAARYATVLETELEFARSLDEAFALAAADTPAAHTLQVYIILGTIAQERAFVTALCPPPPASPHERDCSRVYRRGFTIWLNKYVAPLFNDLLAASTVNYLGYVVQLTSYYDALLPTDVILNAEMFAGNARRVRMYDSQGQAELRLVERANKRGRAAFVDDDDEDESGGDDENDDDGDDDPTASAQRRRRSEQRRRRQQRRHAF